MDEVSEVIGQRRQKAEALVERGLELYPNDFKVTHTSREIKEQVAIRGAMDESLAIFAMAGRIVARRSFGKAAFVHFTDQGGKFQAYVKQDEIGQKAYTWFRRVDVGDFVGMKGTIFQTKTGEWTLLVKEIRLLCKAMRPLPEKFHGLRDPEKRYRQRYLDLIMNPGVKEIFKGRARIIQALRDFLCDRGFLEVETPMMQPVPGGAEASPFKTFHKAMGMELFLRIAPELYLKRLVIGGMDAVFELNRNFRNEGVSTKHNPEFTMLEFYLAYATYDDLMTLTEEMLGFVAQRALGGSRFTYQGSEIDLSGPWRRYTLKEALSELGGVDPSWFDDKERLLDLARSQGIDVIKKGRQGKILTKLFDVLVEPKLIQPTFIVDYPVEISPLARRSNADRDVAERFELFIGGYEIANGFSELNDPMDQKQRFLDQVKDREEGDGEAHYMDEDYVTALEYGMPPAAGEGIGIDRLVMLLTDTPSIREVILFPLLKSVSD